MAESVEKQDNQKTIVAFVVGLLIGGLLVWAFSGGNDDAAKNLETQDGATETASTDDENDETSNEDSDDSTPTLSVGEGKIVINDQPAGMTVDMESATYPVGEGWIGVQQYDNDQFGYLLGVVRFSESQGLVPSEIVLQNPTVAGKKYAIVIYKEDGDFDFSRGDEKLPEVFTTFTAQ
ncbi:MAG TPA: hypothetical protein VGE31_02430 [Candidatus Paceibacterota bacterium]